MIPINKKITNNKLEQDIKHNKNSFFICNFTLLIILSAGHEEAVKSLVAAVQETRRKPKGGN